MPETKGLATFVSFVFSMVVNYMYWKSKHLCYNIFLLSYKA